MKELRKKGSGVRAGFPGAPTRWGTNNDPGRKAGFRAPANPTIMKSPWASRSAASASRLAKPVTTARTAPPAGTALKNEDASCEEARQTVNMGIGLRYHFSVE